MAVEKISRKFSEIRERSASFIARSGMNPNVVTISGALLAVVTGGLFATGHIMPAGIGLIVSGLCDLYDGAIARTGGKATPFGAFLDSTLDRYADLAVWVGIMIYYARLDNPLLLIMSGLGMSGTLVFSYSRARAESFIPSCRVGFFERAERHIMLIAGCLAGHLATAVSILAIGTNYDSLNRILHTRRVLGAQGR